MTVFKIGEDVVIVYAVDISNRKMNGSIKKGTFAKVVKYECKSLIIVRVEGLDEDLWVYSDQIEKRIK